MANTPDTAVFYTTNRGWPWGAPDYVWPTAAERLLANGVRVQLFIHPEALHRTEVKSLTLKGAEAYEQPPFPLRKGRLSTLRNQLKRTLGGSPPSKIIPDNSHIFINQGADIDLLYERDLIPVIQRPRVAYDIFVHLSYPTSPIPATERDESLHLLAGAHRVYFNSRWTREITETKLAATVSNAETFTLPIRFSHPSPRPWPSGSTARFACICRLDVMHKGLDVLLLALKELTANPTSWRLDLYGDGTDADIAYLQNLITHLQLSEHVSLHPYQTHIETIWDQHHMLLLTSRYEGLGLSMLEAMACGRPVLRTPYGGAEEWIEDGQTGYLCPAPEPALIQQALSRALDEFSRWKELGDNAFKKIATSQSPHPTDPFLKPFGITP